MAKEKSIKAGLLGVGLNTYWNQFEGLRERLEEYQNEIGRRMGMSDVKVINVSIVDSQESVGMAVETLLKNRIDVLLCMFPLMRFLLRFCPLFRNAGFRFCYLISSRAQRLILSS